MDISLKTRAKKELRRWLFRLLLRLFPSERLGRIRVYDIARVRKKDGRLGKVMLALQRIESVCPGLMMRVRNHLGRIVVVSDLGALSGAYHLGVCMLAARFVEQCSLDSVSAVIVHEATHAALHHRGLSRGEKLESWGEELCLRVDRRFYQKATGREPTDFQLSDLPIQR
jgi:hypothetical protein